jgi:hypothetical protein
MLSDYTFLRKEYLRTWRVWYRMCRRCKLPQHGYVDVAVDENWDYYTVGSAGFLNFLDDMGPMEDPGMEIIRNDAFGDYTRANCQWQPTKNRMKGKRWNKTKAADLLRRAKANGISRHTLYSRIERGWDEDHACSLPPSQVNYKNRII